MSKKIKQITGILLVMLLFAFLITTMLFIWDFIEYEGVKEIVIKVFYTFGVVYVISLLIIFIADRARKES